MAKSGRPGRHRRVREAPPPRYSSQSHEGIAAVLYDSDIIIELLRGRPPVVEAARRLEQSGVPTWISPVSVAEIYAGLRPGEDATTQAFFEARGVVSLDAEIGRVAGSYLARYARSNGVELGDALVAATATTTGMHLWTRNRKHYPMPDVKFYQA